MTTPHPSETTPDEPPGARRGRTAAVALALLGLGAAAAYVARPRSPEPVLSASVVDYLSARDGTAGFARAAGPVPIAFPADAGPHPDYQTEWWYYTGNLLAAPDGDDARSGEPRTAAPGFRDGDAGSARRLGFQLTFFRRALAPPAERAERASAWAAGDVYLAHFAVTDGGDGRDDAAYHSGERLARGAAGLAGATGDPFRVWTEDWSAVAEAAGRSAADQPVRLRAADGPAAIDLVLTPAKGPVLHGEGGYSRKGTAPGNASFYYSYPRLAATGVVTTAGGTFRVAGDAWMDHEWSTSALEEGQVGWDWFSLQLDDGRELMVFQLREAGGGIAATSGGSLIAPDGAVTRLSAGEFALTPVDTWTSPRTGATYPSGWRVEVPTAGLALDVAPIARDQELAVGFRYWEGAVAVSGTVGGWGYVELTGYASSEP